MKEAVLLRQRLQLAVLFMILAAGAAFWGSATQRPAALLPAAMLAFSSYVAIRVALESGAFSVDERVRDLCRPACAWLPIVRWLAFVGLFGVIAFVVLRPRLQLTDLLKTLASAPTLGLFERPAMDGLFTRFAAGGWAMWLILFWLVCSIAVIAERAVYLWGASINKEAFLATMQKCILAGDVAKAVKLCSAANAPLARIVQAGLVKVNRPDEEVQTAMDEAALQEMPNIAKRTGFLALFANLAMLNGLLGTIVGLIKAFGAVAGEGVSPDQKARILAEGISEAMNCTAFGLIAALVALAGFALLNGKTQALEEDANDAAMRVHKLVVANRGGLGQLFEA
jgi:biopolymer transport protein ExbB